MMWLISDQVMPVRTSTKIREAVSAGLSTLGKISPLRDASCSAEDKLKELVKIRSAFGKSLQTLQMNTNFRTFETTMTEDAHKRRMPILEQITPLLLQVFLRDITACEGDILDLQTAKQWECSSAATICRFGDLSKDLSKPLPATPSDGSTTADVLLEQVRGALVQALHPQQ